MRLLETTRLGTFTAANRIVMAPLGRARNAEPSREALARSVTYYAQRAMAGLIMSEATHISEFSVSRPGTAVVHAPGQMAAWARVTEGVHAVEVVSFSSFSISDEKPIRPACQVAPRR